MAKMPISMSKMTLTARFSQHHSVPTVLQSPLWWHGPPPTLNSSVQGLAASSSATLRYIIQSFWLCGPFYSFGLCSLGFLSFPCPLPPLITGLIQFSGPSHSGLFQLSLLLPVFSLISINKNFNFLEAVMSSFIFYFSQSMFKHTREELKKKRKSSGEIATSL